MVRRKKKPLLSKKLVRNTLFVAVVLFVGLSILGYKIYGFAWVVERSLSYGLGLSFATILFFLATIILKKIFK